MLVLVAYATVEGQSRKIASHMAETLEKSGHQALLVDLNGPGFALPGTFDRAILCGSIHIGRYPPALVSFVSNWKSELMARPCALVTVSLAIASEVAEEVREAQAFPLVLASTTGFKADMLHHAAGALKYLEYDFFKRWMMRRIATKEGGPDDVSKDHELTDWKALDAFVADFIALER
ncbi:MAG: flavodoxin domain-containing protein [Rhizobiaceae bacterium]